MTRVLRLALAAPPPVVPAALALAILAGSALAQPMSGAEFEAYVEGHTLTYNADGTAYGIEEYLKNRRVRWAFMGDECVDGVWYEQNGMICFTYENDMEPQCWTFEKGPNGLIAKFQNDPGGSELYEAKQSSEPMACMGPKVGV